jgi:hypothetical protein
MIHFTTEDRPLLKGNGMVKTISLVVAAVVAGAASTASAFEFSGAQIDLEYRDAGSGGGSQTNLEASAAISFGSGIGLQFGIKNADYNPGSDGSFGYELHGTYGVSDQFVLGVFAGSEEFTSTYDYAGVEADFSAGAFSLEVAGSRYDGPGYRATHLALDGAYGISDQLDVLVGYHRSNSSGSSFDYSYLGASYEVYSGVDLTAKYGKFSDGGDEVFTLGVGYTFGDGSIFRTRSYTELFPSD